MEVVGYVFRTLSGSTSPTSTSNQPTNRPFTTEVDPYNVLFFVLQYFFIVVAPVLFSASIYTILSVLINRLPNGQRFSPLPPKVILATFIACDIVATVVQVTGAALIGSAESNRQDPRPANHILLGGLAFQVLTFLVFVVLTNTFLWRARAHILCRTTYRIKAEVGGGGVEGCVGWDFIRAFQVATMAVYLRTCFRLAETAQGLQQPLMTHEVFFGCLEFAPIVIAVYLFIGWHPGRCLPPKRDLDREEGS